MSSRAFVLACVACLPQAATASASFGTPDRPGQPLSVPPAQLNSALSCWGNLSGSGQEPILLVLGTTVNPQSDFGYSWEPVLRARQWLYCHSQGGMVPRWALRFWPDTRTMVDHPATSVLRHSDLPERSIQAPDRRT